MRVRTMMPKKSAASAIVMVIILGLCGFVGPVTARTTGQVPRPPESGFSFAVYGD